MELPLEAFPIQAQYGAVEVIMQLDYGDYNEVTHRYAHQEAVMLAYLSSPEEATEALKFMKKAEIKDGLFEDGIYFQTIVGNVAVLESEKGLFENHISKATLPSTVSGARDQQLKQGYNLMLNSNIGEENLSFHKDMYDDNSEIIERYFAYSMPNSGNCTSEISFERAYGDYLIDVEKEYDEYKQFYTNDSYLDVTREEGYVFQYSKYKPGFVYEVLEYGDSKGKINIYGVYHDDENLNVPAKINGIDVAQVQLLFAYEIKNITVPEGVNVVWLTECDDLENITLPSTLKTLNLESKSVRSLTLPNGLEKIYTLECPSLKTINFDGYKEDFEMKFGKNANDWCHIWLRYDEEAGQAVYKDITISVVCKNGTFTYPQNNAQA